MCFILDINNWTLINVLYYNQTHAGRYIFTTPFYFSQLWSKKWNWEVICFPHRFQYKFYFSISLAIPPPLADDVEKKLFLNSIFSTIIVKSKIEWRKKIPGTASTLEQTALMIILKNQYLWVAHNGVSEHNNHGSFKDWTYRRYIFQVRHIILL